MSTTTTATAEKEALWESYHEHVANTLFPLGDEISQFIVDEYNSRARLRSQSSYASLVKKAIYNEWAITEGLLELTFQWPDKNKSTNDIIIVLRNWLGTPQLQIKEGWWCPKALLNSDLVQRFVRLDEEYGDFLAARSETH